MPKCSNGSEMSRLSGYVRPASLALRGGTQYLWVLSLKGGLMCSVQRTLFRCSELCSWGSCWENARQMSSSSLHWSNHYCWEYGRTFPDMSTEASTLYYNWKVIYTGAFYSYFTYFNWQTLSMHPSVSRVQGSVVREWILGTYAGWTWGCIGETNWKRINLEILIQNSEGDFR